MVASGASCAHAMAFLRERHEERAAAGCMQRRHGRFDADPVGVRLDDRGAFGGAGEGGEAHPVLDQRAEVDGQYQPGRVGPSPRQNSSSRDCA